MTKASAWSDWLHEQDSPRLSREEIISAYLSGEIGRVEFFELAQDLEISFDEIGKIMREAEESFEF